MAQHNCKVNDSRQSALCTADPLSVQNFLTNTIFLPKDDRELVETFYNKNCLELTNVNCIYVGKGLEIEFLALLTVNT